MENNNILNLEQLSENYDVLLFDTCALIRPLNEIDKDPMFKMKSYIRTCNFIKDSIPGVKCHLIPFVIRELFNHSGFVDYCESLYYDSKKDKSRKKEKKKEIVVDRLNDGVGFFPRKMRRLKSKREKLVKKVFENDMIFELEPSDADYYNYLLKEYKSLFEAKNLAITDRALIYCGCIAANKGFTTAIVTNDKPLIDSGLLVRNSRRENLEQFNFYRRNKFDEYLEDKSS